MLALFFQVNLFSCQRMKIYCIEDSKDVYSLRFAYGPDVVAWSVVQFLNWYLSYRVSFEISE